MLFAIKFFVGQMFRVILAATSPQALGRLLAALISSLLSPLQAEFIAITLEVSSPAAPI